MKIRKFLLVAAPLSALVISTQALSQSSVLQPGTVILSLEKAVPSTQVTHAPLVGPVEPSTAEQEQAASAGKNVQQKTPPVSKGPDPEEVVCVAKVIIHEAGNQPYNGMVAIAQVIRNRMQDGRFAKTACGVVHQPRQFFNVNAYNPPRNTKLWEKAVQIATYTLDGEGTEIVPGALYFNSAGGGMPGRKMLAQVGGQVFYR